MLAGAIILVGILVGSGLKEFGSIKPSKPTVDVKGISERMVKANKAIWTIEFSAFASSFQAARKTYSQNVKDIKAFLIDLGFKEEEFSFSPPNTEIYKEEKKGKVRETIFDITSKAIIQSNDVDKIKSAASQVMRLLDKNILLKKNDRWSYDVNPRYLLNNFDDHRPSMLAEAVKSAKSMAQKFAEDVGSRVGKIIHADQGGFSIRGNISELEPEEASIMKKIRVVSRMTYSLEE